ncbi:MAG: thermonuclease family protein [Burkholderiaceae bacterium]
MTHGSGLRACVVACLLGLVVAAPASAQSTFAGVVTRVSDGDTVWVRPDGAHRKPVKLRLRGIDAPERCQEGGVASTAALSALVLAQRVEVTARARDGYGRLVGDMHRERDGVDTGAWMVRNGHAWSGRFHGRPVPYAREEELARAARRGLFADADAVAPAQFRKRHGPCG